MTFWQRNIPVAHRFGLPINGGKVCSLYTPYQPAPNLRVYDAVQIQGVLRIVVKRGGYTHLRGLQASHIIEIIQAVVVVIK